MRRSPLLSGALILPLVTHLAACGDPLRVTASEPVIITTLQVYPFTQVPPSYPAGINVPFALPVSVTALGNFDVAFDLDEQNNVVVMTPRTVVASLTGARRVGLLQAGASYEAVTSAPPGPFTYDSVLTIVPGEVVVIEAHRGVGGDICSFSLSPNIYAKLQVTAISTETSAVLLNYTVNPNCGFRSFEPGIPRD